MSRITIETMKDETNVTAINSRKRTVCNLVDKFSDLGLVELKEAVNSVLKSGFRTRFPKQVT